VNSFVRRFSPVRSMTCGTLQRLVQALSTTICFVSNFENASLLDLNGSVTRPLRNHHVAMQQMQAEWPSATG
ncbi:hypothetical protein, partial [Longimicrobium sp.]|uniref:hypothetical protein n=1 Tax=Longimicrobium sp. TaxID=2029185 RepID=UPI003B3B7389